MARLRSDTVVDGNISLEYNALGTLVRGRCERAIIIDQVDIPVGAGAANLEPMVFDAALSLIPINSNHPDNRLSKLRARSYRVVPIQGMSDGAKVIVGYSYDSGNVYTKDLSTTLAQEQTDLDRNDNAITVLWYPDTKNPGDLVQGGAKAGYATVNVYRTRKTIVIRQTITAASAAAVENAIDDHLEHTNSGSWMGGSAGTWLCSNIELSYDAANDQYLFTGQWQYNRKGWKPVARYQDTQYGTPSNLYKGTSDADPRNNGFKRVDAYHTANFSSLLNLLVSP